MSSKALPMCPRGAQAMHTTRRCHRQRATKRVPAIARHRRIAAAGTGPAWRRPSSAPAKPVKTAQTIPTPSQTPGPRHRSVIQLR